MSIWTNLRKRGLKDILRPKKWKIYLRYIKMKAFKEEYEELRIDEYTEQIVHRMSHPGCQLCIKKGECLSCGCPSPELFYDKDNECADLNWLSMLSPEAWKSHKLHSKIVIDKTLVKKLRKYGRID